MKLIFILFILIILFVLFKENDITEGYCSVSSPTIYTVDTLASYDIGDTKKIAEGSCMNNDGVADSDLKSYGIIPDNGEFKYAGYDSGDTCAPCPVAYPAMGTGWTCATDDNCKGGSNLNAVRPYFTRTAYNADKNKCCSKSAKTDDGKTCDPEYRSMNKGKCVDQLASLCGTASGFSSNEETCRNFCSVEIQNGKTTCDNLIKTYCASDSGKSDTSCDCINNYSAIETVAAEMNILGDPVCYYSKCLSNDSGTSPLLTKAMSSVDCTICNLINNDIMAYDNSGTKINITQTCNTGTSSAPTSASTSTTGDSNMITNLGDFSGGFSSWITNNWIMLTIFVVLLMVIIGVVFFML
jgi:hypothetical protein